MLKVLIFTKFYLPGYRGGGPIRTIANIIDHIGDGIDFRVVTSDRDLGDACAYEDVSVGQWQKVGKAHVLYLGAEQISFLSLRRVVRDFRPSLIYLNSFFDPQFTLRILLLRRLGLLGDTPVLLAPRGEFSPGALQIKAAKKELYLSAGRLFRLYRGVLWQASGQHDASDIMRKLPHVGHADIKFATNLSGRSRESNAAPCFSARGIASPLRVCFLSRIMPNKNLDFALRCLSKVRSEVTFTIHGPKESAAYWDMCQSLIQSMPTNIRVVDGGEVEHSKVQAVLQQHDLFFLPTKGENFGHVIHEALRSGLPVLTSDQTPWSELSEIGAGWSLSLDSESRFADLIDQVASWPAEELAAARERAFLYGRELSQDRTAISENRRLFAAVARSGEAI